MDSDKMFFSHDFLTEFINVYRQLPSLWDAKSKDYINSQERQKSWEHLLLFCESRLGSVDLEWLKRKVHSMKGSFNKELKKMKDARRSGFTGEWIPKLWYYDLLLFTKSHMLEKWMINVDYEEESQTEDPLLLTGDRYGEEHGHNGHILKDVTNSSADSDSEGQNVEVSRKRKASQIINDDVQKRRAPLENVLVELGKSEDDDVYEAIGKVVASKLRALAIVDYTQFIRADKLINDAIYKGFQKQLTPDCEVAVDRQPQYSNLPTVTASSNSASHRMPPPFPHQTYNYYFNQDSASASFLPQPPPLAIIKTPSNTSAPYTCPPDQPSFEPTVVTQSQTKVTSEADVVPQKYS